MSLDEKSRRLEASGLRPATIIKGDVSLFPHFNFHCVPYSAADNSHPRNPLRSCLFRGIALKKTFVWSEFNLQHEAEVCRHERNRLKWGSFNRKLNTVPLCHLTLGFYRCCCILNCGMIQCPRKWSRLEDQIRISDTLLYVTSSVLLNPTFLKTSTPK